MFYICNVIAMKQLLKLTLMYTLIYTFKSGNTMHKFVQDFDSHTEARVEMKKTNGTLYYCDDNYSYTETKGLINYKEI